MSAPAPGPNAVTPTGSHAPLRRPKKVNIFNTSRKKQIKKVVPLPQRPPPVRPANGVHAASAPKQQAQEKDKDRNKEEYDEFPIFISRRAFDTGQRFHVMKLQTRAENGKPIEVNPYNEKDFTRPLRLHRRYARDKIETADQSDAASGADDKEREQISARRLERQAEREENQKLIAPTGGETNKSVKKKTQKKVEEGRDDTNPVRKKRQQLRYEEARPWHLEDFESKHVWVGSYEQALSESTVMFEVEDGGFRMVPLEKWYKFIQTNRVNAMSAEEVEKYLQKKVSLSRWAMGTQKGNDEARRQEIMHRMAERRAARDDDDDKPAFIDNGDFQADKDMLDMEYNDEFQDDDEGMLYQGDDGEDGKEIEQRLWLEMRDAGLSGTGVKDENLDPEEEERKRQVAEEEQKRKEKKTKKALMKRENKGEYLSDDDSDPFDDTTEDEDGEQQRAKEEEQKLEEAKKNGQSNSDKSGASSRGTNTPSGRPEKRPNPDMSDLSGNESGRKKAKGLNGNAVPNKGTSRSLSPDAAKSKPKMPRPNGGSGSGSDTDTSRVGRTKMNPKKSSPVLSSASNSRAQSPKAGVKAFPTLEDVRAAIPSVGIEIKALVALFKAQVGSRGSEFITLVKAAGVQDKTTGRIMPK